MFEARTKEPRLIMMKSTSQPEVMKTMSSPLVTSSPNGSVHAPGSYLSRVQANLGTSSQKRTEHDNISLSSGSGGNTHVSRSFEAGSTLPINAELTVHVELKSKDFSNSVATNGGITALPSPSLSPRIDLTKTGISKVDDDIPDHVWMQAYHRQRQNLNNQHMQQQFEMDPQRTVNADSVTKQLSSMGGTQSNWILRATPIYRSGANEENASPTEVVMSPIQKQPLVQTSSLTTGSDGSIIVPADKNFNVGGELEGYRMYKGRAYNVDQSFGSAHPSSPAISDSPRVTKSSQNNTLGRKIPPSPTFPTKLLQHDARHVKHNGVIPSSPKSHHPRHQHPQHHHQHHNLSQQQQQLFQQNTSPLKEQIFRDHFRQLQESKFQTAPLKSPDSPQSKHMSRPWWKNQKLKDDWSKPRVVTCSASLTGKPRPASQRSQKPTPLVLTLHGNRGDPPSPASPSRSAAGSGHHSPRRRDTHSPSVYRLDPRAGLKPRSRSASPQPPPKSILKNNSNTSTHDRLGSNSSSNAITSYIDSPTDNLLTPDSTLSSEDHLLPFTSVKSPPLRKKGASFSLQSKPSISRRSQSASAGGRGSPPHRYDLASNGSREPKRKSVTFNQQVRLHLGGHVSTVQALAVDA
ncbi:uncharacterized protein LOC101862146 [Aplysia californica]|uniref:Uncharacterized protein LOC101862146 n=1 Tax=Aplysia californica TaxID=6500 RepID=A0ABM1AB25_APLCA|nr:uncharacterized protein LOC101862146 [Aplysia californica]